MSDLERCHSEQLAAKRYLKQCRRRKQKNHCAIQWLEDSVMEETLILLEAREAAATEAGYDRLAGGFIGTSTTFAAEEMCR